MGIHILCKYFSYIYELCQELALIAVQLCLPSSIHQLREPDEDLNHVV